MWAPSKGTERRLRRQVTGAVRALPVTGDIAYVRAMRRSILLAIGMAAGLGCAQHTHQVSSTLPPTTGEIREMHGIRYVDVVAGAGTEMSPRRCVYTHYTGWLADGTKFGSSRDGDTNGTAGEPVVFPQGLKRVIDGWDVGFTGMRVGGRRRLFVPYRLAYGDLGRPPAIPQRADLIFDVELLALADPVRRCDGGSRASAVDSRCPDWNTVRGNRG